MAINVMSFRNTTTGGSRTPAATFDDMSEFTDWASNCLPGAVEMTIVVVEDGNEEVEPEAPTRDGNTVTVPNVPGVNYTPSTGEHSIDEDSTLTVTAEADVGFVFPEDTTDSWDFEYEPEDGD